jgi:hypothetical protein
MIKGLKELKRKIGKQGFEGAVNHSMRNYVKKVVEEAKRIAPNEITYFAKGYIRVDPTNVGSSIYGSYKSGQANFEVLDPQGPYIEFGTGRFAAEQVSQYEPAWQDLAATFIVNRQGILMSNPFMYPAIKDNEYRIIEELEKKLNG